jgi:ADP-heptose:LPS heptosyltransferase
LLYTDRVRVTSTHIADQNAELSVHAGARLGPGRLQLSIPPEDVTFVQNRLCERGIKEYFVLSPGGGWRAKCWPPERFGQLSERIYSKLGLRSVINYGPGEEDLAEAVRANSGDSDPYPFCGNLGQLMALLRKAHGAIAGDTGPLHLADALLTPVVGIYGPTNPARNGIYFQKGIALRAANVETTHKRLDTPHPSLSQISVDEVFEAVMRAGVGA